MLVGRFERAGLAGGVGGCGDSCTDCTAGEIKSSKSSKSELSSGPIGEVPEMSEFLSAMGVDRNCDSTEGVWFAYNGRADAGPDERKSENSSSSNVLMNGFGAKDCEDFGPKSGASRVGGFFGDEGTGVLDRDEDDDGGGGMRKGTGAV